MTPHSNFNRMITNSIVLAVRHSETGELHGGWPKIADAIYYEMCGIEPCDEVLRRMQEHLFAAGLDYLTANSPVIFFRSMDGELNLVSRELVDHGE